MFHFNPYNVHLCPLFVRLVSIATEVPFFEKKYAPFLNSDVAAMILITAVRNDF